MHHTSLSWKKLLTRRGFLRLSPRINLSLVLHSQPEAAPLSRYVPFCCDRRRQLRKFLRELLTGRRWRLFIQKAWWGS